MDPNIAIANQANVENKKVCFKFKRYSLCIFAKTNSEPIKIVTKDDDKKLWLFSSWKA